MNDQLKHIRQWKRNTSNLDDAPPPGTRASRKRKYLT